MPKQMFLQTTGQKVLPKPRQNFLQTSLQNFLQMWQKSAKTLPQTFTKTSQQKSAETLWQKFAKTAAKVYGHSTAKAHYLSVEVNITLGDQGLSFTKVRGHFPSRKIPSGSYRILYIVGSYTGSWHDPSRIT